MKKLFLLLALLIAWPAYGQQTIDPRLLPAGVPRQIQVDGVNVTGVDPINIQQSSEIDPADVGGGVVQWALRNNSIADGRIISITTRAKLPSQLGYEDEANSWTNANSFAGAVSILGTSSFSLAGSTSGLITIGRQAAAGTYNFNLPITAGTAGQALLSGGGGVAPMAYGTLGLTAGGTNRNTAWIASRCVRVNDANTALEPAPGDCGTGAGGGGHVIYDVGGAFTARAKLRFLGSIVTIADNAGNDSTDVTVTQAPVSLSASYAWTGAHSWRDGNFTIADDATPSKTMQFQLSSLTGPHIYTLPDADTNLLGGSNLGVTVQAFNAKLAAISGLTWAADQVTYATGASAASQFGTTAFTRGMMAGANAAAVQTTLGLVPGTNVQGYSARLFELASLASTNNRLYGNDGASVVYWTVTNCPSGPAVVNAATRTIDCGSFPAGTISGTAGKHSVFLSANSVGNSSYLTDDANGMLITGQTRFGTTTTDRFVPNFSDITGHGAVTVNWKYRGTSTMDAAFTCGTLVNGNSVAINSSGCLTDSGQPAAGALFHAYWDGAGITPDGTNCTDPVKGVINSGPRAYYVQCPTAASAEFDMEIGLTRTVTTFTLTLTVNDLDSSAQHFAGTFKAQCRASGAQPNTTWGSTQAVNITMTTANTNYTGTTAAITPNGSPCTAGSILFIKFNADGNMTDDGDARILGVALDQAS